MWSFLLMLLVTASIVSGSAEALQMSMVAPKHSQSPSASLLPPAGEMKKAAMGTLMAISTGQLTSLLLFASRKGIGRAEVLLAQRPGAACTTAAALLSLAYIAQPDLSKGPSTLITDPSNGRSNFNLRRQLLRWSQVCTAVAIKDSTDLLHMGRGDRQVVVETLAEAAKSGTPKLTRPGSRLECFHMTPPCRQGSADP